MSIKNNIGAIHILSSRVLKNRNMLIHPIETCTYADLKATFFALHERSTYSKAVKINNKS